MAGNTTDAGPPRYADPRPGILKFCRVYCRHSTDSCVSCVSCVSCGSCVSPHADLIQSELAGLAFDSLQQVFRKQDILMMFETDPLPLMLGQPIWIVIDPAAGGPQSDYVVVSVCRVKGCVVVRAV